MRKVKIKKLKAQIKDVDDLLMMQSVGTVLNPRSELYNPRTRAWKNVKKDNKN